jgi:predicted nucleic acid-binding protein
MMSRPRIYLDSCCFIDVVKERAGVLPSGRENDAWFVKQLLKAHAAGDVIVQTSMAAVGECLAVEDNEPDVPEQIKEHYRSLLTSGQFVHLVNPTPRTARLMQDFRWVHKLQLRSVDAMHLAAAVEVGCLEFVTTDGRLRKAKFLKATPVMGTLGLRMITAPQTALLPSSYTQAEIPQPGGGA